MADNLLKRLENSHESKDQLLEALLAPVVSSNQVASHISAAAGRNYTKQDLVNDYIMAYFEQKGVPLLDENMQKEISSDSIYSGVNKQPLKIIGYGIGNASKMPVELMQNLSGWENLYMMAGLWQFKDIHSRNSVVPENSTIVELVCNLIDNGIEKMEEYHENVEDITQGDKNGYVTPSSFAYSKRIKQQALEAKGQHQEEYDGISNQIRQNLSEADHLKHQLVAEPLLRIEEDFQQYDSYIDSINNSIERCRFPEWKERLKRTYVTQFKRHKDIKL